MYIFRERHSRITFFIIDYYYFIIIAKENFYFVVELKYYAQIIFANFFNCSSFCEIIAIFW